MRIRSLVCSLVLLAGTCFGSTATLTGKFRSPTGAQFNGYVRFSLPFAGAVDTACDGGGSCLALPSISQYQIVNGTFQTSVTPRLIKNFTISPAGTYYHAAVYSSSGALLSTHNFVIGNVSSFDVGAALQTSITAQNISYINPADLNGNNTWTGTQTFNGNVVFNGAVSGISLPCSSVEAANTVCGNNTGAPANPAYVKVNSAMTDSSIAPTASPALTGTPTAPTPAAGDNSTTLATTAFVKTAVLDGRILSFTSASISGGTGVTTNTVLNTQNITMPGAGCPCRVYGAFQVNFTNVAAGETAVFLNDGANNFATNIEHRDGSTGSAFGVSSSAMSPVTYANNAVVTFTVKSSQNTGNTVTTVASNGAGGQNAWVQYTVFPSN